MALRDLNPRPAARFDDYLDSFVMGKRAEPDGINPELASVVNRFHRVAAVHGHSPMPTTMPFAISVTVDGLVRRPASRCVPIVGRVAGFRPIPAVSALLLCVVIVAGMLFSAAQGPAGTGNGDETWLYTVDWENGRLVELDPTTLDERAIIQSFENQQLPTGFGLFHEWLVSKDGTTVVHFSQRSNTGSVVAQLKTFEVFDAATGQRKSAIKTYDNVYPKISDDGRYLLLGKDEVVISSDADGPIANPPPLWSVYDTITGRQISMIQGKDPALTFGAQAVLTPDGSRLVTFGVDPASAYPGPWQVRLVIYDVASGAEVGRMEPPDVSGGYWPTGNITIPQECFSDYDGARDSAGNVSTISTKSIVPGLAISPDGKRAAILHADSNTVTFIDLDRVAVSDTRKFDVSVLPTTELDAVCDSAETMYREAHFSSDGRSLYMTGSDRLSIGLNRAQFRDLGLSRLDVDTGQITVHTDPTIGNTTVYRRFVGEAGGQLYSVLMRVPAAQPGAPAEWTLHLQRFDATSLKVLSEQQLQGNGTVLLSPVRIAPLESSATPVAELNGDVVLEVRAVGGDIASLRIVADGDVVFNGQLNQNDTTGAVGGDHIVITSSNPQQTVIVQEDGLTRLMQRMVEEYP